MTVYLKENRVAVKSSNQMTSIKNISNVARLYSLNNNISKYNFEHYKS